MITILKQFRDPLLDTSGKVIGFYPREFYPLDNFSSFQVDWKDRRWPTSEHAYQAAHFIDTAPDLYEEVFIARSAHDSQKLAEAHKDKWPVDWKERCVDVMTEICRLKLRQNPYVEKKLLQTGNLPIVEDSPKDSFWGWGLNHKGENQLGKIWMKLRNELRNTK